MKGNKKAVAATAAPLPTPFSAALSQFLLPLAPDPVAYGVIQAAGDENLRAHDLAPLIHQDREYRQSLFAQTFLSERLAAWEAENPESPHTAALLVDRILGLLGKAPVRNLVACARLARMAGTPPPLAATDSQEATKLTVTPSREIPHALGVETLCQDRSWISPETAFAAGLHYDWLATLLKLRGGPPDDKTVLAAAYQEGTTVGKMAYQLGLHAKDAQLGRALFSAGLLLPIGKVLMHCLFPATAGDGSWAKFAKDGEALGDRAPEHYLARELKRFGATHLEMSALVATFGRHFAPIEKSIAFAAYPEALKRDASSYGLAQALSIAVRMAKFGSQKSIPLEDFQRRWLKANGIEEAGFRAAIAAGS